MTTFDFINSNIGNRVYISGDGDLSFNGNFTGFIANKTEFILVRLAKSGKAVLRDCKEREYAVPAKNVKLIK